MQRPSTGIVGGAQRRTRSLGAKSSASIRYTVARYVAQGLAANTRRAYAADMRHFKNWGGYVPAAPSLVARYLAACAKTLKVSTLSRRLAAITHAHIKAGRPSPCQSPLVRATMRGIKRVHGVAQKQAKPITITMLRALVRARKEFSDTRNLRDRALLLVGFAGGFRRSELVAIRKSDLSFSRSGLTIKLRRSKTDPNSLGRTVALPNCSGLLCPVSALRRWLAVVKQHEKSGDEDVVFRGVDRYGSVGRGLCDASVGGILKERMHAAAIEVAGYSAHSLRAGLITAAARAGASTWSIQRQTGHRSERTVHKYIRELTSFEMNATRSALRT